MADTTTTDFSVKWGTREIGTYPVPGDTYEDVYKFFQKKKQQRYDWVVVSFGHSIEMDRNRPPKEVAIKVSYSISLPVWSKASSLKGKAKTAWQNMILAAQKHARKHVDIIEDEVEKLTKLVDKEKDTTKWTGLYRNFATVVKKAQDAYDSRTGYGEKEGMMLPPPEKVKD